MGVGDTARLGGAGREQPSVGVPDSAADTHQTVVGDGAFVVDQQPFTAGVEVVKPCARVEIGRQVLPAAVLLVSGGKAVGVE